MAQALKYDFVSLEDYLLGEHDVDMRSEYVAGRIYAMAGASRTHNTIASSFHALIETHLREECRVWQSDMKTVAQQKVSILLITLTLWQLVLFGMRMSIFVPTQP